MTLLDQLNSFCNFGILAGLLMVGGLALITFFIWADSKTKRN